MRVRVWHKARIRAALMKKTSNWKGLVKSLEKYNKESAGLESDFGYKTPPVRELRVKTTQRAADLIDDLLRS